MSKGNCIVGQSGGPTAAINATLLGVIRGAMASPHIGTVYGMRFGIQGLLEEKLVNLGERVAPERYGALRATPAAYLGSCRYKLPADDDAPAAKIIDILRKYDIRYFFYIGGNDSMDTIAKLSRYAKANGVDINFVGVPKTIDNDLVGTDHTPGYGSAAKYIAATVREVACDARVYDRDTVSIIEIMGRNAGWLTAASALARTGEGGSPDLIYLPECPFSMEQFLEDVRTVNRRKRNVVVAVSEGIRYADGRYVCEGRANGTTDIFGHKYLSGAARELEDIVREQLGFKARGMELNIPQRCAAHLASTTDLDESEAIGAAAVEHALGGATGVMMAFQRVTNPYRCSCVPLDIEGIANAERTIPREWINAAGNDVTQAFIDYAYPLIQGEEQIVFAGGVPVHLSIDA